jgi:hypothetical protein
VCVAVGDTDPHHYQEELRIWGLTHACVFIVSASISASHLSLCPCLLNVFKSVTGYDYKLQVLSNDMYMYPTTHNRQVCCLSLSYTNCTCAVTSSFNAYMRIHSAFKSLSSRTWDTTFCHEMLYIHSCTQVSIPSG